jgi:hypothetical protein
VEGQKERDHYEDLDVGGETIKTDSKETGSGAIDVIDLAHDRDQWRAVVNTVTHLRVP